MKWVQADIYNDWGKYLLFIDLLSCSLVYVLLCALPQIGQDQGFGSITSDIL